MGTNFNPTGLKTFAEMGFQPQFNINTAQNIPMQAPGQSYVQAPVAAPQTAPLQNIPPTNVQNSQNVNLENSPKKDTVVIAGKEVKKKNVIFAGLAIAATVAVAGVLAFRGRNKIPMPDNVKAVSDTAKSFVTKAKSILESAKIFREEGKETVGKIYALSDEADAAAERAHNKITDVYRLYSQKPIDEAFNLSEGVVKEITHDSDKQVDIMREYTTDKTTLLRESIFNRNKILERIEEICSDGKRNIISVNAKGKVISYEEGVENLRESVRTDKILIFENSRVAKYTKNSEAFVDGRETADIILDLSNHTPMAYKADYIKEADGLERISRAIDFKQGEIWKFKEDIEIKDTTFKIKKKFNYEKNKYQEDYEGDFAEQIETRGKTVFLEDDKIKRYEEGVICKDDKPTNIERIVRFVKGKPQSYSENIQISDTGAKTTAKTLNYSEGKPVSYLENINTAQNGTITAQKEVTLVNGEWIEISTSGSAGAA